MVHTFKLYEFLKSHKLASILFVGILVRIILIPFTAHPVDSYVWYITVENILKNGPLANPPLGASFFPPVWQHYLLIAIAYPYDWLAHSLAINPIPMASLPSALNFYPSNSINYVPGVLFNSIFKIPLLLSDIAATFLIYKIAKKLTGNTASAEKAAMLWFLNPFLIWISAGWGTWDTLAVLFSLASIYFLLNKRIILSSSLLAVAVATKLYPLLFVIPILLFMRKNQIGNQVRKQILLYLSVFSIIAVVLMLPSMVSSTFFTNMFLIPDSHYANLTVANPIISPVGFGLTYWSVFLVLQRAGYFITTNWAIILPLVSLVSTAILLVFTYWKVSKFTFSSYYTLLAALMSVVIAFFLAYRIIPEQFFIWIIPFLILMGVGGRIKHRYLWGLSILAFLYSILNCPLPYFLLPLSPSLQNTILSLVNAFLVIEPVRIITLAIIGIAFSVILIAVLVNALRLERLGNDKVLKKQQKV